MRGRLIKIERPKGYVNIDEVYEALNGVEKEEDFEYGDYGEVLSKWATCDYGEVLDAISYCDVIKAIPLDKVKQAREEIENINPVYSTISDRIPVLKNCDDIKAEVLEILDKLIAESEG